MSVEIRNGCLWVGGERVPLLVGEVHFWRVNPARWGRILDSMQRLGLKMIATYVAWEYHEIAPGRFDFAGETEPARNLLGFLELVRERGLRLFIRPGPYAYAEWTNAGVPDRVVGLPRLSDEYRREALAWMEGVVDAIRPFFATSGRGPICLFQPDNEMDLFSHWFEGPCGLDGSAPGYFHQFLRSAYPDAAAINDAWGTNYGRIEDARAMAEPADPDDPFQRARARDYWRFQHWAVREAVAWHVREYRRLGVDLPMVANYYPGGDVQNWRELSRVIDLVGIDWYPRSEFGAGAAPGRGPSMTGAGAASPEEEHRRFLDTCRYQRAVSRIPWSPELECGVWHGYHDYVGVAPPNHYRLLFVSALMAGLKGLNWYMFVGRDNWYYSPINERGDIRPELGEVFLDCHRVFRAIDPPSLEKVCGASVFIDPAQVGTDNLFADNPVLRAMYDADLDIEIVDPDVLMTGAGGDERGLLKPLLFYGAADWLDRAHQALLLRYVESGGHLVFFRRRPLRDERFRPHNGLGLAEPQGVLSRLGKKVRVDLGEGIAGVAEGAVWAWDAPALPAGATPIWGEQIAGTQQAIENADAWMNNYRGRRWVCGYSQARGRGRITCLGLPAGADLARAVHRSAGATLGAQAEIAGVKTALFRAGDGSGGAQRGRLVVLATNMNDCDVQARIAIDGGLPPRAASDAWTGDPVPREDGRMTVSIPRRGGGAWVIG